MGKRTGSFLSVVFLLLGISVLAGCTILEEMVMEEAGETAVSEQYPIEKETPAAARQTKENKEGQPAGKKGKSVCESYEEEVEPGVCSYKVDCKNPKTCEAWAENLIFDMEEWYGELTYSEEWYFDEKMLRKSKKDADVLASYPVRGNTIRIDPSDEDEQYYAWLWERFTWIIPSKERKMVSNYEVFEHVDLMAYVIQDDEDYEKWTYAVNVEQATFETERVLTDIHEFGHLLALNAKQVDPYKSESSCKTYMWDEGCANRGSYMYEFYKQFWEDGDSEDEENFVSDYAMNDVYEDFAESWSHFVVTPRPEGDSIVEQKIEFFYDYEELVMLRANLLGRMASWLERNVEYE
ncbi:hypothetical protein [Paenibacillus oceani]|uniref:Uncharacterized protein n=1 Tax=Paenibacillus oceani TaxID=2772510 RepID=A0A927GZD7_9BACL|nr:hypothetical protein [Paenibacillus oceani]MBD2862128.1 hypothetical protein [Paenibacillus oceani]